MRALILNGARDGEGTLATLHDAVRTQLLAAGWSVDDWLLRDAEIAPCDGDFACWVKTPGICAHRDAGRLILEQFIASELAVWLTPVTFGGYSWHLTKVVDRLGPPLIVPLVCSRRKLRQYCPRYATYPRLLVLGVAGSGDEAAVRLFERLVERNAATLYAPAHAARVFTADGSDDEPRAEVHRLLQSLGAC